MNDQFDVEELVVIKEAYRSLLKWLAGGVVTLVAVSFAGGVWATNVQHDISKATSSLEKIARELERRPTAAELNLQWRTLGKLNPDITLPPLMSNGVDD